MALGLISSLFSARQVLRIDPITGHSDGALIDRSVPPIPESVPIADTPSMAWVTALLTAESRRL